MHLEPVQWGILAVAAVIIGLAKTGIPGLGILATVLMAVVLPAKQSTGMLLPMLVAGDICGVACYRLHASRGYLVRMAPWAVLGVLLGVAALGRMDDRQIRPLIGGIVLALVGCNLLLAYRPGWREGLTHSHVLAAAIGILGGFTTMVANAAGPIMVIYLLAMGLPKNAFLGTSAWFFFLINLFKVPFSAWLGLITWSSLSLNAILLPGVLLGALLGVRFARRIPEKVFANVAQVLAAAAALKLLLG